MVHSVRLRVYYLKGYGDLVTLGLTCCTELLMLFFCGRGGVLFLSLMTITSLVMMGAMVHGEEYSILSELPIDHLVVEEC